MTEPKGSHGSLTYRHPHVPLLYCQCGPLIKLLQAGVSPDRTATEFSRILSIWTDELKEDSEQLQGWLSGLAEQMTTGIEGMHEGLAEASDKAQPHVVADTGGA